MMLCGGRFHELFPLWAAKAGWSEENIEGFVREWEDLCRDYQLHLDHIERLEALLEKNGIPLPPYSVEQND